MAREIASCSSTRHAVQSPVGKLVMAYHTININFFFSEATPSALHISMHVYRYSEPQAYVCISVAVYSAIHLTSHNASFVSGAPHLRVFHVSWYFHLVVFHMSWHFKSRGITHGMALHAIESRGITRGIAFQAILPRVYLCQHGKFFSLAC